MMVKGTQSLRPGESALLTESKVCRFMPQGGEQVLISGESIGCVQQHRNRDACGHSGVSALCCRRGVSCRV